MKLNSLSIFLLFNIITINIFAQKEAISFTVTGCSIASSATNGNYTKDINVNGCPCYNHSSGSKSIRAGQGNGIWYYQPAPCSGSGGNWQVYTQGSSACDIGTATIHANGCDPSTTLSNIVYPPPPANDNLANAIAVNSVNLPFSHDISSDESNSSTKETSEADCVGGVIIESWWYYLTVATKGDYIISSICNTCTGSQGELSIALYTGASHPLTEIVCQDSNNENSNGESLTEALTPGSYCIRVTTANNQTPNGLITTSIIEKTTDVPTLSQWGLIILALLFMTLGTLYLLQPQFSQKLQKEEV